jgi:hypothetical protein
MPKIIYYECLHRYWQLKGYRLPKEKYGFYKVVSSSHLKYDLDSWVRLLKSLPDGITELVAHPGLYSEDKTDNEHFRKQRVMEFELFSNPKTKEICEELGISLINYKAV